MRKSVSLALGIIASVAVASATARFVASAQERNAAAVAVQEPGSTPLTVSSRVYDKDQLLARRPLSDEVLGGRAIWVQRCAYCHDGVGQPSYKTMGRFLDAELVQSLGEDTIRAFIDAGNTRMPGFRYTLQRQQVDQLIAFLKTVTPDQKPTPEQLNGAQGAQGSE